MAKTAKIILAGEGGQGVQSVAEIIAETAYNEGREALYIPNFGVEQRGGVSVAFLQVDDEMIGAPKFQIADLVVALSDRAVERVKQYLGANTIFIYDASLGEINPSIARRAKMALSIPALEVAKKQLHPRVFNIIIMGAVLRLMKVVSEAGAKNALEEKLGDKFKKDPKLRELNFKALEYGMEFVAKAG